ncbi:DUF2812 domain-containing protein [Solibacillus sp. MA9]|uniref:DUF2812 domain-containing protein n=1 Tax=Solibacillus palustris TaxID=2908203 RepID=A0ABS9UAV4_9BACL|nr:DUF2812 domain-containing protein [Solibacillus sp. MA9]MCH7321464.1 DUF2812 domain-containing protein [Solibacillus sp. MA9]
MRKKRKLVPVELWQRGQMESWFTEQAQHGLKLEKINSFMATFQKTEPQDLEYRMIIMHEKDNFPTNTKALEQEGWQYVVSYEYYHIFCSQQADATTEIEVLTEQAASFEGVLKKITNQIIIYSVAIVVMLALAVTLFLNGSKPITNLIEGYSLSSFSLILVYSCIGIIYSRELLMIRRIKKQLEQGIAFDYRANWRSSSVKKYIWKIGYFAIVAAIVLILLKQVNNRDYETLPTNTGDLPLLRLEMIEKPVKLTRNEMMADDIDWKNSLMKNWSIFAPIQYELRENVYLTVENQANYSPQLKFRVIECTMPSIATALFDEWVTYYRFENDSELSHTAFDRVLVEKIYKDTVRILTKKDNRVQYVDYLGEASIETILKALENL